MHVHSHVKRAMAVRDSWFTIISSFSLHVANTYCICSPLAGHILVAGSFWCLLPALEMLPVAPLFRLSDYILDNHFLVLAVSTWGFSRILGYCRWCSALFFHFSSFIDLILVLNNENIFILFCKEDKAREAIKKIVEDVSEPSLFLSF